MASYACALAPEKQESQVQDQPGQHTETLSQKAPQQQT